MPEPVIDFRAAPRSPLAAQVRFVVVGGVAMHLQGANNLTVVQKTRITCWNFMPSKP